MKNIRDLGVVHVATKAQGGAENAALQESIRLSARYAAAIKLLQGMETASAEVREGDAAKGEEALKQTDELLQQSQQLRIVYRLPRKNWLRWNHGVILLHKIYPACVTLAIRWAFIFAPKSSLNRNG